MTKTAQLQSIANQIQKCRTCKRGAFGLPVPGEGNPNAQIVFVGEAPGKEEAKTGRPFVGRSGQFLNTLLKSIGLARKDLFITSPIKYYPGKRNITKKDIAHGRKHLLDQLNVIKPRIVGALGNVALAALVPEKRLNVSRVHGKPIKTEQFICFPTFHPAAAMRFPKIKKLARQDFRRLKRVSDTMRRAQRVSTQIERSAGAVVYRGAVKPQFLILHYEAGHWDFPKGNSEHGETEEKTIRREIEEETGITRIAFVKGFRETVRYTYRRAGTLIQKEVVFRLAKTTQTNVTLSFEHTDYAWLAFDQAVKRLTYKNAQIVLKKANDFLEK